jgi:hypothetical protein
MTTTREPFIVHCGKCEHEWAPCFVPVPADLFAKVAKRACPACGSRKILCGPLPRATADGDAIGWLTNGDTGTSSLTIWHVLMRRRWTDPHSRPDVPLDPGDFGRCYRLLEVMPAWRARLGEIAAELPKWAPFVAAWDEMTALYEEELPNGRCPKLYALMQRLRGGAA